MATINFDLTDLFDYYNKEELVNEIQRMIAYEIKNDIHGCIDYKDTKAVRSRTISSIAQKITEEQMDELSKNIGKKVETKINEITTSKVLELIDKNMSKQIEKIIMENLNRNIEKHVNKLLEGHIDSIVREKVKCGLKDMFK